MSVHGKDGAVTRRSLLATTLAAGLAVGPGRPLAQITDKGAASLLAGINLAGADFGKLPGRHGTEYLYPTRANVDYYAGLGFRLIRLPFKWERLQPELSQSLDKGELALLSDIVGYATAKGLRVVLDPHNYAKRRLAVDDWSRDHMIGSSAVPAGTFDDLWFRLAGRFVDDPRVMFGLMNEPVGLKAPAWLDVANGAIAAIRRAGALNTIMVPGVNWTGAHSWAASGNEIMKDVEDPARSFVIEVHQYFDGNSSGTSPDAVSGTIGSQRIQAFQEWARANGLKAFLGEFNGGRNPTALAALRDLLNEMNRNRDVWMGWAAWAGGPRWPADEMFNLEPWPDGRMKEQTAVLAEFAAKAGRQP